MKNGLPGGVLRVLTTAVRALSNLNSCRCNLQHRAVLPLIGVDGYQVPRTWYLVLDTRAERLETGFRFGTMHAELSGAMLICLILNAVMVAGLP